MPLSNTGIKTSSINLGNPVNPSAPLNRGLITWWLALPGLAKSQTWVNLVIKNNPAFGQFINSPTWTNAFLRPGGFGYSLLTNNAGQRYVNSNILVSDPKLTSAGSFAFWARPANIAASGIREFSFGATDNAANEFAFQHFSDNNLYVGWFSGGVDHRVIISATTAGWSQGTWSRWTLTWINGGACVLYRDGKSIGSTNSISTNSLGSTIFLGSVNGNPILTFEGWVDDYKLWNRALSTSEVFEEFMASSSGYQRELNRITRRRNIFGTAAPVTTSPRITNLPLLGVG
jgi:hypothetical protein